MNPIDQLIAEYKHGYRTSEFWVALLAGIAQPVVAGFDPNQRVSGQLTNLTWIAISYVLGRAGLKVVRVNAQAKLAAAQTAATASADPAATNGAGAATAGVFGRLDLLVTLRDRGILSSTQYEEAKQQLGVA